MRNNFTLAELAVTVFCLAIFAALIAGMTPRDTARAAYCTDKMHNLLQIAHQYVTDHRGMWMAPCNTKDGAYVRSLSVSKYLKTPWRKLMTARETEITCPELPRVPRYKVMQGYGSVYNNGSSYDPQGGHYIYSPEYAFSGTGKGRRQVPWTKRVWFADSLNLLKPPYPSPLLMGTHPACPKGAEVFGALNLTHSGRVNVGAVDGSVIAVAPEELREYYMPLTMNKPLRHTSVPLRMYIDNGVAREVKR